MTWLDQVWLIIWRIVTMVINEPHTCSNYPSDGYPTLEYSSDEGQHNQAQGRHLSVLE